MEKSYRFNIRKSQLLYLNLSTHYSVGIGRINGLYLKMNQQFQSNSQVYLQQEVSLLKNNKTVNCRMVFVSLELYR